MLLIILHRQEKKEPSSLSPFAISSLSHILCNRHDATQALLSKAVKDSNMRMYKILIEEDELEVTEEVKATGDWRADYDKCVLKHLNDKVSLSNNLTFIINIHCC